MSEKLCQGVLTCQQAMSEGVIAVSACLTGIACRYDGQSKPHPLVKAWADAGRVIAVCPEVLGGLPIPRPPAGIKIEDSSAAVLDGVNALELEKPQSVMSDKLSDMNPGALVWQGKAHLINREGRDVTAEYKLGAQRALALAEEAGIKLAVLKQHSPSCGCGSTGGAEPWQRLAGDGVTAALFKAHGLTVLCEEELSDV